MITISYIQVNELSKNIPVLLSVAFMIRITVNRSEFNTINRLAADRLA